MTNRTLTAEAECTVEEIDDALPTEGQGVEDDGLPRCATCAQARVIPDVRPIEWRCRGGYRLGGLVYRGRSTAAFSQHLRTPRECAGYVRMV